MITGEILTRINALEKSISGFYQAIQDGAVKSLDELKRDVLRMKEEIEELKRGCSVLNDQMDSTKKELLVSQSKETARIEAELNELENKAKQLSEQMRRAEQRIDTCDTLRQTVDDVQKRNAELERKQISEAAELDRRISLETASVPGLAQKVEELQRKNDEFGRKIQSLERSKKTESYSASANGGSRSTSILTLVSLGISILLLIGIVIGVLLLKKDYCSMVDKMKAEAAKTSVPTPAPTPIPTEEPTPALTEEPTPETTEEPSPEPTTTPDPLAEEIPAAAEWEAVSEPVITVDEAMRLEQAYRVNETLFANVFLLQDTCLPEGTDVTLFRQYGFLETANTGSPDENQESDMIVLGVFRTKEHLCVFFTQQTDAAAVDYRQAIAEINSAYWKLPKGNTSREISLYTKLFRTHQCHDFIDLSLTASELYPISERLVPEEIRNSVGETDLTNSVWMYCFDRNGFALLEANPGWTKEKQQNNRVDELNKIADCACFAMAVTRNGRLGVVLFMDNPGAEPEEEKWYSSLDWYVNPTEPTNR